MLNQKIRVGDFYQLQIGVVYQYVGIQEIKNQLVALHGVQLVLQQPDDINLLIKCKKSFQQVDCPYFVQFKKEARVYNLREQIVFRLESFFLNHQQSCQDREEAAFLQNMHALNKLSPTISRQVRIKFQENKPLQNPTHAIQVLAKQEQLNPNFYLQGIFKTSYRNKLKKRLDQIFMEACGQYQKEFYKVYPSQQSTLKSFKKQSQDRFNNKYRLKRKVRQF